MVIKTPLSAESCAAQQEAVRWQSWDCAEWGTIFLKLEGADKTCQSKESFCLCVHLYLCCFACVCTTSEPRRDADLTATVTEHADFLLNVPRAGSNWTSCAWKGRSPAQSLPNRSQTFTGSSLLSGTHQLCIQCAKSFWESGCWL